MSATMLRCENLSLVLGGAKVLEDISCQFHYGELVAIVGPNGAGKTSLLKTLLGLSAPSTGCITLAGQPLAAMSLKGRAQQLSYLPQSPVAHWPMTVKALVGLGRLPFAASRGELTSQDHALVEAAMSEAGVSAFADRPMASLSGGEQARAHLARCFAGNTPVIMADEPVASLDPHHQLAILTALKNKASSGRLVIVILHDLGLAARFADRVLMLDQGKVQAFDTPQKALEPKLVETVFSVEVAGELSGAYQLNLLN